MATIVVASRDSQITPRSREHAENKLSKLEKYFDGISKIEAVLGHSGDESEVELVISVRRGKSIVCQSRDRQLYAAIDRVIDKAEAQLTKRKERLKTRRGPRASEVE